MEHSDAGFGWDGEVLDLDAYLARIAFDGDLAPTVETLRALHFAHVSTIPFENLEIVLGRPIPLDVATLQDKMVRRPRGGYCYEHTKLFAAALERLGFGVTGLASRVSMATGKLRPATHALLQVETAETADTGRLWLSDVGFGGSPLCPIELLDGAEASRGGWHYRLERQNPAPGLVQWVLHTLREDGWFDLHGFTLDPRYAVDYEVINHYVSTHPDSPFVGRAIALRMRPDVRYELDGTVLTTVRPDGSGEVQHLGPGEVPKTLEEVFGVVLEAEDTARLVAMLRP
ncbi:arylamine N-acetyltransferase family protein [Streptomyces sp. 8N616]|uniref:arylamine N-acetyltransferase family protein n=1 Tax=Streptomyces sp. 8N616 TaxID=3457414 RepID=UPI003FD0EFA0